MKALVCALMVVVAQSGLKVLVQTLIAVKKLENCAGAKTLSESNAEISLSEVLNPPNVLGACLEQPTQSLPPLPQCICIMCLFKNASCVCNNNVSV